MKYIIVLALILVGCAKPKPNANVSAGNLYVYGDSISSGLSHPTYVENLATILNRTLVQNSHGGTSIFDKNSQGDSEQYPIIIGATWEASAVVMWAPGENDAIYNAADATYLAKYQQAVNDVINKAITAKVTLYLGTPIHNADEARFVSNSIVDQYAAINRIAVAQANNPKIKLVDYNAKFVPSFDSSLDYYSRFNTSTGTTLDGAHPNIYGYQLMTQIFLAL